jgi:hypothetical protein
MPCRRTCLLVRLNAMSTHLCTQATWLDQSPTHVVGIHCKGGKGRTGMFISSLLIWTFFFNTNSIGNPPASPAPPVKPFGFRFVLSTWALASLFRYHAGNRLPVNDVCDLGRFIGALSYFAKRRTKSRGKTKTSDMQAVTAPCQQR